ncbi:MAG: PilN domain-containing protein [Gemmatimonadetes bacterium]|nr:PilN domain-containing protein [Gemmatimonadota bacterium]
MLIEINLLLKGRPAKRRRRAFALPLPRVRGLTLRPTGDPWVLGLVGLVIVLVLGLGYLTWSQVDRRKELAADVQRAVQDSARYGDLIATASQLAARRDTLESRLTVIEEIDRDRYVWAHILDEVARALPEYTWLRGLTETVQDTLLGLRFRIDGNTGNNLALTRFMRDLEASPFIQQVTLVSVEAAQLGQRVVNTFVLEAAYQQPDSTAIRVVPVLAPGE